MITSDDLDAIDLWLIADGTTPQVGKRPPWYGALTSTEPVPQDLKDLGVNSYATVPEAHKKSKFNRTKWVCIEVEVDPAQFGTTTALRIIPELHLRVTAKFGRLSLDDMPFWTPEGEVNVAHKPSQKHPRGNQYGNFPPGSKEYLALWAEKNREKVRESNRRQAAKRREALRTFKALQQKIVKGRKSGAIILPDPLEALTAIPKNPTASKDIDDFIASSSSSEPVASPPPSSEPCSNCGKELPLDGSPCSCGGAPCD